MVSQNERKKKEMAGKYEYQSAHEGTPLMIHANPYFKYPKDLKSNMPKRKRKGVKGVKPRKINNVDEKEGNVLFLNQGSAQRRTPYKGKALSRVKSELSTLKSSFKGGGSSVSQSGSRLSRTGRS